MSSITSRNTLKGWFRRGLKPLESQFVAWIDAYWHKEDLLPTSSIDGLETTLNKKAETADVQQLAGEMTTHAGDSAAHKTAAEQSKLDRLAENPDATYARKEDLEEVDGSVADVSAALTELQADTYRKTETYSRTEVDEKETGLQEYVAEKIAEMVNGSPEALDTLYEIAKALGDDPNFATTIMEQLNEKADKEHVHTKAEITDFPASMPASDVSAWAKAASKPSYSFAEITGKPTTLSGYGIMDGIYYVVEMGDVVYTVTNIFGMTSNVFYVWGTIRGTLELQFGESAPPDEVGSMYYNEWLFQFTATDNTSLVLPETVQWADGTIPAMTSGKTYQVSIVNDLAVFAEF